MGKGKAAYLEARINRLMDELEKVQSIEEHLGTNSDYVDGCVLQWDQKFDRNGLTYTFVALKAAGHWYTTGIFQRQKMTFDELVDMHLAKALEQGQSIYQVTAMEEI